MLLALAIGALVLATAAPAAAQAGMAGLVGRVVDHEGNPIEGATVRLVELSRGVERTDETDEDGRYTFRALRPGQFEVTAEKEGYRGVQETVELKIGRPADREYRLVPAISPAEEAFRRGLAAFNEGNFEEAAKAFEETAELAPDVIEAHSNLAAAYARLGREEDALKALEKVTALAPDSFDARVQLGASYAMMNRFDQAIETYEEALQMEHDATSPAARDAWLNLGTLYFMSDRTRDAIGAYENVLAADPGSAKALLSLGKCHFNLGEPDQALARFKQVVEVAPGTAEATEAEGYIEQVEKAKTPD